MTRLFLFRDIDFWKRNEFIIKLTSSTVLCSYKKSNRRDEIVVKKLYISLRHIYQYVTHPWAEETPYTTQPDYTLF